MRFRVELPGAREFTRGCHCALSLDVWSVQETAEFPRFRPSGTQKPQWLDVSRSRSMLLAAFIPLAAMRMVTDSPRADRDNACLGCPARETARPIPRNTCPYSKRETFGICSGTFVTLPAIRLMLPLNCDRKWQGTCSNCASGKTCRSSGRPVGPCQAVPAGRDLSRRVSKLSLLQATGAMHTTGLRRPRRRICTPCQGGGTGTTRLQQLQGGHSSDRPGQNGITPGTGPRLCMDTEKYLHDFVLDRGGNDGDSRICRSSAAGCQ